MEECLMNYTKWKKLDSKAYLPYDSIRNTLLKRQTYRDIKHISDWQELGVRRVTTKKLWRNFWGTILYINFSGSYITMFCNSLIFVFPNFLPSTFFEFNMLLLFYLLKKDLDNFWPFFLSTMCISGINFF